MKRALSVYRRDMIYIAIIGSFYMSQKISMFREYNRQTDQFVTLLRA